MAPEAEHGDYEGAPLGGPRPATRVLGQQAKLEVKIEKVICVNMESTKALAAILLVVDQ